MCGLARGERATHPGLQQLIAKAEGLNRAGLHAISRQLRRMLAQVPKPRGRPTSRSVKHCGQI
jgi:hypothetical protein